MLASRPITLVVVCLVCISCASLKPSTLPYKSVESPGFFDIGVGYGRVMDTRDTDNDDAEGLIASFKAYPAGRWYGEPKKEVLEKGVTALDRLAASRLLALDDTKRASLFYLQDGGIDEKAILAFEADVQLIRSYVGQLPDPKPSSSLKEDNDLNQLLVSAQKDKNDKVVKAVEAVLARDQRNRTALLGMLDWESQRESLREASQQILNLLSNPEVFILPEVREALQRIVSPNELTDFERDVVASFITPRDVAPKWHVIRERNEWYHRFSVFYGRSVSDFDSGGLESQVNVVGLGWDISPDLALQVGRAFYEVDDGSGMVDSDSSWFFGVSLNLYAFKALGKAILDAGSPSGS